MAVYEGWPLVRGAVYRGTTVLLLAVAKEWNQGRLFKKKVRARKTCIVSFIKLMWISLLVMLRIVHYK